MPIGFKKDGSYSGKVIKKGEHLSTNTEFKKGQKQTKKWKRKNLFQKGHPNYCLQQTKETKKKIADSHKGAKSHFWKGGITLENTRIRMSIEYSLWREAIFARDNWTCQKYGIKGGKIHPHHIQNFADYPELRLAIDNGITLSDKAHREFHKKYGKKNNTRKQIEEFLI